MENNPDVKKLVILTNGPVSEPLETYDGYDARSEIENSLFRESKQVWFIKRPPENSKAGFCVHAYLTILTMALTRAFRDCMVSRKSLKTQAKIFCVSTEPDAKNALSSACRLMAHIIARFAV